MNKTEFKKYIRMANGILAKKGSDLHVSSTKGPIYYPFRKQNSDAVYLASAMVIQVINGSNSHRHNVVVSYCKTMGIRFWCGDSFLEGGKTFTEDKCEDIADQCVRNLDYDIKSEEIKAEIVDSCGRHGKSEYCHFWGIWNKSQTPCKHVALVLSLFGPKGDYDIDIIIEHYKDAFKLFGALEDPTARPIDESLTHYAFAKHIVIEGSKGSGKTFQATKFLSEMNTISFAGHSGVESLDLKGYLIRYPDSAGQERTVWQDGALAQAFRQASNNIPTVLFIDEIGRIPSSEQSILVSALTKDFQGYYSFNTGRVLGVVDGVATTETLKARADYLWVVGTTNVGAEYNVDDFESALKDRFRFIRLETDSNSVKSVLAEKCKSKSLTQSMSNKLLKLYQRLVKLKNQAKLSHAPNLRHIVEIIELASDEDDVVNEINRTVNLWVGRKIGTGELIEDELGCVNQVIKSVF